MSSQVEARAVTGSDGARMIAGHAAVYNRSSQFLQDWQGGYVEQVAPGAFDRALVDADTMGLFNHDPNQILGRSTAGTLRMASDMIGLGYEIDPPDTSAGRDVVTNLDNGNVRGSSFSFTITPEGDEWSYDANGMLLRTITDVGVLYDVGPVTFPAYLDSDSMARAALSGLAERRSIPLDEALGFAKQGELRKLLKRTDAPSITQLTDAELRSFLGRRPEPAAAHPLLQSQT